MNEMHGQRDPVAYAKDGARALAVSLTEVGSDQNRVGDTYYRRTDPPHTGAHQERLKSFD